MKTITRELWDLCRKITFIRHGSDCYTCHQKNLEGSNRQCGHGFPKGALGADMAYDLRILRPQCYNCNINHGGMGALFWENLKRDIGEAEADALLLECKRSKSYTGNAHDTYTHLIGLYKNIHAALQ